MSFAPETYPKPLHQGRPTDCRRDTHIPPAKKILTAAANAGCAHVVAAATLCAPPWWGGGEEGERGALTPKEDAFLTLHSDSPSSYRQG